MAKFNLIDDSFIEIVNDDFFDKVALVAHNCYQVAEKTHEANIDFVTRLIQSKHLAMIEHYRFTFLINDTLYDKFIKVNNRFIDLSKDSKSGKFLITTSLRPILEAFYFDKKDEIELFNYLIPSLDKNIITLFNGYYKGSNNSNDVNLINLKNYKTKLDPNTFDKHFYLSYKVITDRGVTHEIVRHRLCSFAQESTRYCNYTKDKFDNSLTFIKPLKYNENKAIYDNFYNSVCDTYFSLINNGCKPDEARSVLPNSLKASIVITASIDEWKNIFNLRCDSHAHPDINRIMTKVRNDMIKKGYIDE